MVSWIHRQVYLSQTLIMLRSFTAPNDGVVESVLIPHLGAAYVSNLRA
jgi:hypothetical protein